MIDWDRVANLRREIGAPDFSEVVEMFLGEADEVVARLAAGKPDPTLEAELHALKGSALNLGFDELAALCGAGEKAAAADKPVDIAAVARCYIGSKKAFEVGLDARRLRAA